jgi:hypothetical protein
MLLLVSRRKINSAFEIGVSRYSSATAGLKFLVSHQLAADRAKQP